VVAGKKSPAVMGTKYKQKQGNKKLCTTLQSAELNEQNTCNMTAEKPK